MRTAALWPAALAASFEPLELVQEHDHQAQRRRRELLQGCDDAAHVAGILWRRQRGGYWRGRAP
jgi:hypothetical protein